MSGSAERSGIDHELHGFPDEKVQKRHYVEVVSGYARTDKD